MLSKYYLNDYFPLIDSPLLKEKRIYENRYKRRSK